MSLKTWCKKHYPVPACDCPPGEELQFDRRKWIGLLPANRKKHGVRLMIRINRTGHILTDSKEELVIDSSSCASCHKQPKGAGHMRSACKKCPLIKCYGNGTTPWGKFVLRRAIRPMIDHIEKAIKKESCS